MIKRIITLYVCLMIAIAAPQAYAEQNTKPVLNIQEVTSQSGITAWLVEDHSVPVIAISFAFQNAGSINDPETKQGLAQLVSNTLDEGAGDLDSQAFQKALTDNSISLSYSASRDDFSGKLKTLTRKKEKAFELLKLSLTQPRFDDEPFTRMRESNKSRIKSNLSNPNWIAARLTNDKAYQNHPYARNSGGSLTSLDTITPSDAKDFHKNYFGKNNLIIGVAGDITADELKQIMDQIFGNLPTIQKPKKAPLLSIQNQGNIYNFFQDIPQTIIQMTHPGIAKDSPDYHTAKVMNYIFGGGGFGSRLMKEVREKRGLSYGIYSNFFNLDSFAGLNISTSTENKNTNEVLEIIKNEIKNITNAPVSDEELEQAKTYLNGSLPLSLTSTDAIAGTLLSMRLDGFSKNYLDTRKQAINAVTADQIQTVARRLLNKDSLVTILVGQSNVANITPAPIVIENIPNAE